LVGDDDQLGSVPRAELGHRPGGVRLHRGQADVDLPRDLLVGQPGGDSADDLALPGGERPSHAVSGGSPLPFAATAALLAGLAAVFAAAAARTAARRIPPDELPHLRC